MKKAIPIFLAVAMAFLFLTVRASADEITGEYRIREEGEAYILEENQSGYVELGEYSSLSECFRGMSGISSVLFEGITLDEPLELPRGKYTLSGKLASDGEIIVPRGADVEFSNLSLTLGAKAYVRIKGGAVSVNSSDITSGGMVFRLDYSASSTLVINSGVISGGSEKALIDIQNGSATVLGGSIDNKSGAAITSDSELVLANTPSIKGSPYGIILESPMHLSYEDNEYFSETRLSVQYLADFSEGTLTEIFYGASARSVRSISLFDKSGKTAEITHFEKTHHSSEENFAGVYLPYTVSFYIDDRVVHEERLLWGEQLSDYTPDAPTGFTFGRWYKDRDTTQPYSFNNRAYSSFSLYGRYELLPPSFSISSMELVYDGENHTLEFDNLSHLLEGGYYTYLWYKDGVEISALSALKMKNVSDNGSYSCLITYVYNGKTASVYAENIKVNIKPKEISLPQIAPSQYTGNPIYPNITATSQYTVSLIPGTDVGTYPQTLTLTDPENTKWHGADSADITLIFEITKATNRWIEPLSCYDCYIGFPLKALAVSEFGNVEYLYSATKDGTYKTDLPTAVGTYFVKAQVTESPNFSGLMSEPLEFSILPEEVVGISLVSPPSMGEYHSFDRLNMDGLVVKAIYNSSREEILENHRLTVIYNSGSSLRAGDTGVSIEYLGATLVIPVTVSPLSYSLEGIGFSDFCLVYDGSYHTFEEKLPDIVGRDGIPLKYQISGGGSDAGEYLVTLTFSSSSRDYITPEPITVKMTVLPMEVELQWVDVSFVYDGIAHAPKASFIDALGVRRLVCVSGSGVFAGESYIAEAMAYSNNYVYKNPTCPYTIGKADYDMSKIFWSQKSLLYNGDYLEVTLGGLPDGVTVVGYTDNRAINVGDYTATASLKYDTRNYNSPEIPTCNWTITPAQYDVSGFSFTDGEYEYDGEIKYPTLSGTMSIGADGIALKYSFSTGAKNVSDGVVTVIITFTTESKNYITPSPVYAKVKILPKGIYAMWTSDSFVYDGLSHIPKLESPYADLKVTGENINAGSYIATAESLDPNYKVLNSTYTYEIKKAENHWLKAPGISDFYESRTPSPTSSAYQGKAEYRYYSDAALTTEVTSFTPGTYYMVATVPESENYLSLTSNSIMFKVIEVVPTGIRAEITGSLVALDVIEKDDYTLYLMYNDGSEIRVTDGISIEYENSETLLFGDKGVKFFYSDFSTSVPISVTKAKYDLSGVSWDKTEVVYNGEGQAPSIFGLPDGIILLGYSSHEVINAGTYIFSAIVSYDEENYEPPHLPDCSFTVKKATVPIIDDITCEYNGEPIALHETDLYTLAEEYTVINSGEYEIVYKLRDSDNYIFEGGLDTISMKITVLPKPISVEISDFDLYLFESDINPDYRIIGDVAEGDDLGLYFYIDGDFIYLASNNPNYSLNVECGRLNRLSYPNEKVSRRILLLIFVFITVIIAIVVTFKNKDRILDAIYMTRTRLKRRNKAYIGYIDNSQGAVGKTDENILPVLDISVEKADDTESIETDFVQTDPNAGDIDSDEVDIEITKAYDTAECNEATHNTDKDEVAEYAEDIKPDLTPDEPKIKIKMEDADAMLSDSMAKEMIKDERERIYTDGKNKSIINVDTLSRNFMADDRVDVNILKQKSLVPYDTAYIKVLARGAIDKPLHVYANDFSLSAVKMILLSGGEARRVITVKDEKNKKR